MSFNFNSNEFMNPESVSSNTTCSTITKSLELQLTSQQRDILQYQLTAVMCISQIEEAKDVEDLHDASLSDFTLKTIISYFCTIMNWRDGYLTESAS